MKFGTRKCIHIFMLIVAQAALANEDRNNREAIKSYVLDPATIYNIPIGNTPTTIAFPGPLSSIDGANISNNPSIKAPVLLNYQDGKHFFSVKAEQPNAQAAANIVFGEQTYAFNFYHREDSIPYRTVRLVRQDKIAASLNPSADKPQAISRANPKVLLGLLDQAKSYHLINSAFPGKLDEEIEYHAPSGQITEYRDFNVRIDELFRFANYDTIVFRISLQNKSEENLFYQPQTVAVRVAQNLYYPSIADASGIVPALSESEAFIAITGKPNGERADLSLRNSFQIVVSRISDPAKLLIP